MVNETNVKMRILCALLIFFLVIVSSQEQHDSGSGDSKDGPKTSFKSSYGRVPLLTSFPGFVGFNIQINFGQPAPQLSKGGSVFLRTEPYSSCEDDTFASYPGDCTMYMHCSCGKYETYKCMSGLHWNAIKKTCDWPDIAKCTSVKSDEKKVISAGTTRPPLSLDEYTAPEMTVKPVYDGTGYKVICYFTSWAWYRQGDGKYLPSDIDETLCTHINYAYAVLNDSTLTIKSHDSRVDIDNEFYKKVTALRAKGIKVLITIGGWHDSLVDKYSRLVNNPSAREKFITNVMQFITKHNFDGLDLDWRYPKCWQNDCSKGSSSDKEGFTALIRELSVAFKPKGLLLSAIVSPLKKVIDEGYEVVKLSKYLDWITVMTYAYYGHWNKHTGHVAPLYSRPGDSNQYYNANFSLNYWIDQGADPQKIIMGMSLYGQSYSLIDTSKNIFNSPSNEKGDAGEFTRARGTLAYYEICDRIKNRGWTTVRNNQGFVGPYAYNGNQWVSYDDVSQIVRKSKFIKQLNLGGGMIWALDFDDFRNRCGCGKYPLLKAINHELRVVKVDTKLTDCT